MRATLASGGAQLIGKRRLRHAGCGPMSIGNIRPSGVTLPSGFVAPHCNRSDWPYMKSPSSLYDQMAPEAATTTSGRSGVRGGIWYHDEVAVAARVFSP